MVRASTGSEFDIVLSGAGGWAPVDLSIITAAVQRCASSSFRNYWYYSNGFSNLISSPGFLAAATIDQTFQKYCPLRTNVVRGHLEGEQKNRQLKTIGQRRAPPQR